MTTPDTIPENRRAPEGHAWQCVHCGKRAQHEASHDG